MIARIARREFIDMVRDGRFRLLGGLVLAVAFLALAVGYRQYVDVERQHAAAQAATRQQWLNQGTKNPHSAAHYGVYAFKPRGTLSLVDTGVDPYVGVATWLEAHKQNEFKYRPAQDRTAAQRFGELTAAQTLLILVPLFIVLTSFSTFSSEREQGTLRAVMSLGIRPRDLTIGKAVGVGSALILVLAPAALMAMAGLGLSATRDAVVADLPRAAFLAVCFALYFGIFLAISLGVSISASSSRVALVVLLVFWVVNSLVAARAASDLAGSLHPVPSAVEFQRAMQADLADQNELQARLEQRRQALLTEYRASSMSAVPVNFRGISLQEGENHGNEVFDRHYGQLFDTYAQQDSTVRAASVVTPLIPMRSLSMGLAGTDMAHHRDFVTAAEGYRRRIQQILNRDIETQSRDGQDYVAGPDLWSRVPPFEYTAPAATQVLATHRADLAWLTGWFLAAVAGMAVAMSRMRID